ncbi:uncharacterized protein LOC116141574 [Pistacia vera]|uniref:uncharacterized protein LOC116141574 n=1 Tax=Pistacia vera TaxID=55513 RepID=UPI001263867A|nr:uncharacterized protein LOC116141574 [Pistacia vera]
MEATREILEKKKYLTKETDQYGWTPLHYAAYYDLPLGAEFLLEFDESAAFITDKDRKMTPLHVASSQGSLKVIEKILFHSPQCYELVDARGWNFLHFAMQEIQALTQEVCNGQRPRGVICSSREPISENVGEPLSEDILGMEKAREPHLVVAALIATVTFAAAFTMPGGYQSEKGQDQGTAILSRNYHFQSFIIADSIAMSLSVSAVFIHFVMALSQNLGSLFVISYYLTEFAMLAMVLAFVFGILAVLPPSVGLGGAIPCICLGLFFLVSVLVAIVKR